VSTNRIFTYGAAMRGGIYADLLSGRRDVKYLGPARCRGMLYDLGGSAALVPEGRMWVAGELYRCRRIDEILAALDALEEAAVFERTVGKVGWRHGETDAWIYCYTGDLEGAIRIPGGSYRARLRRLKREGGER
jgi:gamma-glutamylcyclotransferase (GGCT)/AIG2-like uncharacterized protein YtfP